LVIHLSKLKKYAAGRGGDKAQMVAAAKERFVLELEDNAADALWAAVYALDHDLFSPTQEQAE
jgi:hypothetical protein